MNFFVPIPLWLYLLLVMAGITFAIMIGIYALLAALVIGFIYLLFKNPANAFSLVIIVLTITYWKIGLPILAVLAILVWIFGEKEPVEETEAILIYPPDEKKLQITDQDRLI